MLLSKQSSKVGASAIALSSFEGTQQIVFAQLYSEYHAVRRGTAKAHKEIVLMYIDAVW